MRSASPTTLLAGAAVAAVAALALFVFSASKTTTQQTSVRLGVVAKRNVAGGRKLDVSHPDPNVKVVRTAVVRGGGSSALVALLRNSGSEPVNDLALAAGVRKGGGEPDYVNLSGSPYFQSHAPAIAPGKEATWVLSGGKDVGDGEPVVTVGAPKGKLPATASSLPDIEASAGAVAKGRVKVTLTNHSAVPQYDPEVYAWATKGGRYVAAGRGDVDFLDSGAEVTVSVPLIGDPKGATVHVSAPPTIFE